MSLQYSISLDQKIKRSRHPQGNVDIDYSKIGCEHLEDPLAAVQDSQKIMVEPVWLLTADFEGKMYADYIREHPDYGRVYLRSAVLERLQDAASKLPNGIKLVVRAGHRPVEVQKRLLQYVVDNYIKQNPGVNPDWALEHARTFVSDPEVKLPPHCCAAAVDVELFDTKKGKLLDFGSPLNMDNEISTLHSSGITLAQKENRMLLLRIMLEAGFASYYPEWWHFSYGDEVWAWFYEKENCLYGLIEI
jgi:zinc D-Ala-D-Ala dipeptidase